MRSDDPREWIDQAQARLDAALALPLVSSAAAHAITAGRADQRLALAALTAVLDLHAPAWRPVGGHYCTACGAQLTDATPDCPTVRVLAAALAGEA